LQIPARRLGNNHFFVNGKPVNIPSFLLKTGDEILLREGSRSVTRILEALETVARRGVPQWIDLNKDQFKAIVKAMPSREDLTMPVEEQQVVELYSK
jgi:small subunit ribosomal protein S4